MCYLYGPDESFTLAQSKKRKDNQQHNAPCSKQILPANEIENMDESENLLFMEDSPAQAIV